MTSNEDLRVQQLSDEIENLRVTMTTLQRIYSGKQLTLASILEKERATRGGFLQLGARAAPLYHHHRARAPTPGSTYN